MACVLFVNVCVCIALRMPLCVSLIRRVCCCHQYGFILSSSSSLLSSSFCCAFFEYNFSSFSYSHPSSQFHFTISIDMHILWVVYEIRFSFNPPEIQQIFKIVCNWVFRALSTIQCYMIFLEFLYYAKLNFYLIWIPLLYCIHCKFDSYGYGSSLTWFVCLYFS